jgi:protein involved in polysaccharide export with SLBB domain
MTDTRKSRLLGRPAALLAAAGLTAPALLLTGCGLSEHNSFMDRSVMGRWEFTPTSVPILERLAAIEGTAGPGNVETSSVRPEDLIPEVEAYRVGPGDEIDIRIQDFLALDREEVLPRQIDPRGFLDLPLLGSIFVDGLPVDDVRAAIATAIIDKGLLKDPIVTVQVVNRRRLTFSVLGAVNTPGLYQIPRPDYRLLDALTASGRFSESVQQVYIIRQIPLSEKITRGSIPRPMANPGDAGTRPTPTTPNPTNPGTPAPPAPRENVLDLIDELTKPAAPPAPMAPDQRPPGNAPANPPATPNLAIFSSSSSRQGQPSSPPVDLPQDKPGQSATNLQPVMPDSGKQAPAPAPAAPQPTPAPTAAPTPAPAPAATDSSAGSVGEEFWIFQDGKWIPVRQAAPQPAAPQTPAPSTPVPAPRPLPPGNETIVIPALTPPPGSAPEPILPPSIPPGPPPEIPGASPAPSVPGAEQLVTQRVIEVPVGPLLAGSAQFNIIIRPGDVIRVPSPAEGLVYVSGEVQRPGPYNLPGAGRLTLLRAIVAAGGLGPLAVPERVDLIRMVGPDRQAMIRLNLRAIAEGTQPDLYLRSDDMINVGTDFFAFPLTVIRNGFRASYGFGFILDRNFQGDVFGVDQARSF